MRNGTGYIYRIISLKLSIVLKYPTKNWDWRTISSNHGVSGRYKKTLESNLKLYWYWDYVSCNPNLSIKLIIDYIDKKWCWTHISKHENMTTNIIEKYIDLPWDYNAMSLNPNITISFVKRHIKQKWNWMYLSKHNNITMDIILDNPHYNWIYIYFI